MRFRAGVATPRRPGTAMATLSICRSRPGGTASRTPRNGPVCHDSLVGQTVLIIDDHASFRASARAILEADGFEVIGEAENGADALRLLRDLRPTVALLDVQLPDMSGFDVCIECGDLDETAIVLVSSRDALDYRGLLEASGARGFIPKAELTGEAVTALLP